MRTRAVTWTLGTLVGLALLWAGWPAMPGSSAAERDIEFHRDLIFGKTGGVELRLNLARPTELEEPVPAVVVIHGGGWRIGRKEAHDDLVRFLAREGFVAATVQYRLAPRHPWPAQVEDVKCAVRWLRANAGRWKLDPQRVAAVGFSAGAHLAMLLGTMDPQDGFEGDGGSPDQPSKVQAVISFFGPTDLDLATKGARAEDLSPKRLKEEVAGRVLWGLLGPEFRKDPRKASPLHYVSSGDAPMMLVQGTRDPLVHHEQATRMMEALTEARVPGEVLFLIGLGHGWADPYLTDTVEASLRFLDRRFRPDRRPSVIPRLRAR